MPYRMKVISSLLLSSFLWGCASTPPASNLSEAELQAKRDYTARLQQEDRDLDHAERLRRAEAYKKGGSGYYNPYWYRSSELSNITVR